jgi:hypothetical protein
MKHKSVGEAIDLLFDDIEMMHSKGGSRRFNVTRIMRRLRGLCQNGTECLDVLLLLQVWIHDACAGRHKSKSLSQESSWCNPLLNPLPKAPSMSIYCFGSRDRPTEIAYLMRDQGRSEQACADKWSRPIGTITQMACGHQSFETTNGDGTIPWLSQTLMCSDREVHGVRGWKGNRDLNPGEVQVGIAVCCVVVRFTDGVLQTEIVELEPEPMRESDSIHEFVWRTHRYASNVSFPTHFILLTSLMFLQLWRSHSVIDTSDKTDHVWMIANDNTVVDILKIAFDLV